MNRTEAIWSAAYWAAEDTRAGADGSRATSRRAASRPVSTRGAWPRSASRRANSAPNHLRSQKPPIVLSAQRTYSNSISMFCSYVSDGRYGWISFCEKQFGDAPAQICFESNTPQHEVAVVVAHNEHLRGVGTALLRRLGEIARENGVHHLIAEVLAGEPSDASGHDGRRLAVHATP